MDKKPIFTVYCDASGIFDRRYQSIGAVSGEIGSSLELRKMLESILSENRMDEIKFADVTRYNSKEFQTAQRFITDAIVNFARHHIVRVDVLTWDTTNSRHSTPGRDDIENLGRLYYHLLCNVTKRWSEAYWHIIIDKNERVDFDTLKECINSSIVHSPTVQMPEIVVSIRQIEELETVKRIQEIESHKEPLVQLADIFAGMSRFSNEKGDECCNWLARYGNRNQYPLPDFYSEEDDLDEYAKSDECRFQLIGELCKVCGKYRLGVNLHERKRLWTPNPANPVNFWIYEPQGDYDRAPIKDR